MAYFRELNMASLVLRLSLAVLCGGLIGLERAKKRRPAGFRTYMLVCLGAAVTMLLSQYEMRMLATEWSGYAAVAAGVKRRLPLRRAGYQRRGFLGAGTVWWTERQRSRIDHGGGTVGRRMRGLAIGAGFYECMAVIFALMLLSMKALPPIENALIARSPVLISAWSWTVSATLGS